MTPPDAASGIRGSMGSMADLVEPPSVMRTEFDPGGAFAAAAEAMLASIESYAAIGMDTWRELLAQCRGVRLAKDEFYCVAGTVPTSFGFVHSGLLRNYVSDEEGNEYNKIFFDEGTFPGSMAALLTKSPSSIAIQALEETQLVRIDFGGYRRLLRERADLMWFQIRYLEENWLLQKEPREVALVQDDASERYRRFCREHPELQERLPLFHIASHLGITPTQLSRIRKAERS